MPHTTDESSTLDPPGRVAVVGAGPLGIEAALYGRFLGYDVTLLEAERVAASLEPDREQPLPMMPDRCLSPLATSALEAQSPGSTQTLPTTVGEWIDRALVPLTETDLLRGRLSVPARVESIETIEIAPETQSGEAAGEQSHEEEEGQAEEVPPDFRLHLVPDSGVSDSGATGEGAGRSIDAEAVILATRAADSISLSFELPAAYFFRIGADSSGDAEQDLERGRREIVAVFAQLVGRRALDLYRPRRG